MNVLERLRRAGIVPVVVLENADDSVSTARAMLKGGIDVMEITFRTDAAEDSIRRVARECPEMLVGAGTVISKEQCMRAVDAGAKFIVAPGFDMEVVEWCVQHEMPIVPGCVTPTEIMMGLKLGLKVLKFFPSNIYGGLNAMKALTGPFGDVRFIPTGGINAQNAAEYIAAPFVHAVGGSWVCPKAEISAGNFEKITSLCEEARENLLAFEVEHLGINCDNADGATQVCNALNKAFGFGVRKGNSSDFASDRLEIVKGRGLGEHGHIAVRTSCIDIAVAELERRGFLVDEASAKYKNGRMVAVYLRDCIQGFAVHLLQK